MSIERGNLWSKKRKVWLCKLMATCLLLVVPLSEASVMTPVVHNQGSVCCKEGFKLIMDVILCSADCCPGLREETTDDAPHLGLIISCRAVQRSSRRAPSAGRMRSPFRRQRQGIPMRSSDVIN